MTNIAHIQQKISDGEQLTGCEVRELVAYGGRLRSQEIHRWGVRTAAAWAALFNRSGYLFAK